MTQHPGFSKPWLQTALAVGTLYALVGVTFAIPASHIQAWRFAAWIVCSVAFVVHLVHERARRGSSPRLAAIHVAAAAALGAFGLAVGANVHSLSAESSDRQRQLLLMALLIWPLITAGPAFLVGYGLGGALSLVLPERDGA